MENGEVKELIPTLISVEISEHLNIAWMELFVDRLLIGVLLLLLQDLKIQVEVIPVKQVSIAKMESSILDLKEASVQILGY